jgi:hypothetical protein
VARAIACRRAVSTTSLAECTPRPRHIACTRSLRRTKTVAQCLVAIRLRTVSRVHVLQEAKSERASSHRTSPSVAGGPGGCSDLIHSPRAQCFEAVSPVRSRRPVGVARFKKAHTRGAPESPSRRTAGSSASNRSVANRKNLNFPMNTLKTPAFAADWIFCATVSGEPMNTSSFCCR